MMKKFVGILAPVLLIAATFLACTIGAVHIPCEAILDIVRAKITGTSVHSQWITYDMILCKLRLPRILMSLLAGSSLAICGAAFQSIFRNPICDPYILGISSGASLGAAIAIITGLSAFSFGLPACAMVSALATLFLIIGIAFLGKRKSVKTLLLAGIAINFLISAIITLLMVVHQESFEQIIYWTMGSFASSSWTYTIILFFMLAACSILLFLNTKKLDILQLGQDTAQSSGVNVQLTTLSVLIVSSILIAATVACCGVIGFVGLIVPHIVRLIFGNKNHTVFIFSLCFGALFCLLSDTLARSIISRSELPVGSITALIGAPYFIFLLLAKKRT